MAFKKNRTKEIEEQLDRLLMEVAAEIDQKQQDQSKVADSVLAYLGLDETDVQDWEEHTETVRANDQELTYHEHVNAVEDQAIDLNKLSLTEKVELLAHDTLDRLLAGDIKLENAQELIATIQAVDMVINVGRDA